MNENSPICAKAIPTVNAALNGYLIVQTRRIATIGLPMITTASAPATSPGEANSAAGSRSIPTETKKSTANASRIGKASDAARRL
jgi:hypothetical protein